MTLPGKESCQPSPAQIYVKPLGPVEIHWPIKMISFWKLSSAGISNTRTPDKNLQLKHLALPRERRIHLSGFTSPGMLNKGEAAIEEKNATAKGKDQPRLLLTRSEMDEQTVGANPLSSTCPQLPAAPSARHTPVPSSLAKPTVSHLLQLQSFLITPICLIQWCFPAYKQKTEKHINTH